ncbi:MAG: c-type cytochrome [Rhodoferax sp.]
MKLCSPCKWSAGQPPLAVFAAAWGLSFLLLMPAQAQTQTGSTAKGQVIFESRCVACHSLDANRVGPALGSVFGRIAGKAPDFSYSKALGAASHVWDRDKLLAWLGNPESVVPGQAMGYSVETLDDRREVVAYLASLPTTHASK